MAKNTHGLRFHETTSAARVLPTSSTAMSHEKIPTIENSAMMLEENSIAPLKHLSASLSVIVL